MPNAVADKGTPRISWALNVMEIDCSSKPQQFPLNPKGFAISKKSESSSLKPKDDERNDMIIRLKIKKAWDMALSPSKSIPMNAFMLYMSGNSIQIFSIMVTVMLLWNSLNAILASLTGRIILTSVQAIPSRYRRITK
jgi:hypothetical protein